MIANSISRHLSKLSSRGAISLSRRMSVRSLSTIINRGNPFGYHHAQQHRRISMTVEHNQWTGDLSFGSPESDFCMSSLKQQSREESTLPVWSHSISFTSPEADFTAANRREEEGPVEWSGRLSFTSPESDFTSDTLQERPVEWSETLSFTSPESDFTYKTEAELNVANQHVKEDYVNFIQNDDHLRDSMAYALSMASAETDFCSPNVMELADERTKKQLRKSEGQLKVLKNERPLPDNLQEALGDPHDPRAMVVTTPDYPFQIVDVSDAWVGLCGYSKEESRHRKLDELLEGPETDKHAVKDMLADLLEGKEATTILTNYTKSGRKFQNRVRVGHLRDAQGHTTHFIGVLQEINEKTDTFVKKAAMQK